MWSNIVFAAFLLVASAVLMFLHRHSWRQDLLADHDEKTADFCRRRYRRRMQASAMIGFVGLAIVGGVWVEDNLISAIYWTILLLIVIWIVVLAFADLMSSRFHFAQLRARHVAEHAALQKELERLRAKDSNGRPDKDGSRNG